MENEIVNAADEAGNAVMNAVETAGEAVKTVGIGIVEETKSMFHLDEITNYLTWANLATVVTSVVAILLLWIVYKVIRHLIKKNASKRIQKKTLDVILKVVKYAFYVIVVAYVLGLFGIKISAIWGAAGIAGVAIGFAAQTSVSNLISGLFVLTEKTMKVGDFIEVDGQRGTIDAVGLLAVKIRTLDNQLVRIPNSTIINSNLMNYSAFPYRRFSFPLEVGWDSDFKKALDVISQVPSLCPTVIKDVPGYEPWAVFGGSGTSGVIINLNVYFERDNLAQTKNDVWVNFQKLCLENDIEIPYTHYDIKILDDVKEAVKTDAASMGKKKTVQTKTDVKEADVLASDVEVAGAPDSSDDNKSEVTE